MTLTVTLTLISLIVMLAVEGLDPLEEVGENPHAAIGLVCIILACVQPIMAAFRPHPGTRCHCRGTSGTRDEFLMSGQVPTSRLGTDFAPICRRQYLNNQNVGPKLSNNFVNKTISSTAFPTI
jgi:hypothetical protein